jgi:Pyruvate/2-oxoglutarate dehydrogenase complex, dihydrolipoamide acyltransferase (E2) component, and related enzymes
MAEVVNMPRLSDTMEEGTVAKWLKKVGDAIEEGDILAEIETDKATMEFESFYSGTLLHIGIPEGEGAPVDSLLAIIGEKGEDISGLISGGAATSATPAPAAEAAPVVTEQKAATSSSTAAIPDGVEIVTMPRLSDTMEEGTVATWLKKVGDVIEEGDILAEIETDKATMEFESFYSGTLLHIGIQEGQSAPVDDVLAIIGPAGTDVSAVLSGDTASTSTPSTAAAPVSAPTPAETPAASSQTVHATTNGGRVFASPLAKRIAADKGIDLSQLHGSGENGRIIRRDIEE